MNIEMIDFPIPGGTLLWESGNPFLPKNNLTLDNFVLLVGVNGSFVGFDFSKGIHNNVFLNKTRTAKRMPAAFLMKDLANLAPGAF